MPDSRLSTFTPTPESIPPPSVEYRQELPPNTPVHLHPLNPLSFLLRAAQIYPDKLALVHPDTEHPVAYNFAVWAQRVQNLAYALIDAGIKPGERVAVIAPNSPLIADAHNAIPAARSIIVPINTRLTPPEVAYILSHSGSRLVLVDHTCAHLVPPQFIEANGPNSVIVCHDTGRTGDPYEAFLARGRKASRERGWMGLQVELDEDAGVSICYTSGTTGRPKGVLTTLRGSYLAAIANAMEARMNSDSTYLWILPMFHAAGWTFPWACTFSFATQITLRTVDHKLIWKHLIHSGVTHYCGAPTVQIGLVNDSSASKLSRQVTAIIAGSAPTAHLLASLEAKNIKPVHVYGLTETYGPYMRNHPLPAWYAMSGADRSRLMARVGYPYVTALESRVVRPPVDGEAEDAPLVDVPRDGATVGEIVTRGNLTMKEYFRDADATRKAFKGGYFHTGDLAVMHPDGTTQIVDRQKDIIISGGENASSLAIEQELASHPDVLEASVIARSHPKWGERPMAFVILRPTSVARWKGKDREFESSLKNHARAHLPGFACPEWVQVVEELPKTSTGKIQKVRLRQMIAKL